MHSTYLTIKLTIIMLIMIFHISSVGRGIHLSMCVVYLDLLYLLSIITNKATYLYPSNTMYSYATYAHDGWQNRRVTPCYTLLTRQTLPHNVIWHITHRGSAFLEYFNLTVAQILRTWRHLTPSQRLYEIFLMKISPKRWTTKVTSTSWGPMIPSSNFTGEDDTRRELILLPERGAGDMQTALRSTPDLSTTAMVTHLLDEHQQRIVVREKGAKRRSKTKARIKVQRLYFFIPRSVEERLKEFTGRS